MWFAARPSREASAWWCRPPAPLTDSDGYQLSVAGTSLRTIEINAEEVYQGLTPGAHLITLKDVADFCEVSGANPYPYTVVAGKTVRVTIRVGCGGGTGPVDSRR